jgi:hypothetical protein
MDRPKKPQVSVSLTPKQIWALEDLLRYAPDMRSEMSIKAIIWLLQQTACLTREICVYLPSDFEEGSNVAHSVHDLFSMNGKSRIDLLLKAMGTNMDFSSHCGCLEPCQGHDEKSGGYTIFMSVEPYARHVQEVPFDLEAIEAIPIKTNCEQDMDDFNDRKIPTLCRHD